MIERILGGDPEKFKLTKFAPASEIERIVGGCPDSGIAKYLNDEFRGVLKRYGVNFDLPLAYKRVRELKGKVVIRRSAILVSSNDTLARVLVVETDREVEVRRSGASPQDPDIADIVVWPMRMHKVRPSNKPWYLDIDDSARSDEQDFLIGLSKIGPSNFVETYLGRPNGYYWTWELTDQKPTDLIKGFCGLQ